MISSKPKEKDFNNCPDQGGLKCCYGIDDDKDYIYLGNKSVKSTYTHWSKPALTKQKIFKLRMSADWRNKRCKLSIFYNDKKMNDHKFQSLTN